MPVCHLRFYSIVIHLRTFCFGYISASHHNFRYLKITVNPYFKSQIRILWMYIVTQVKTVVHIWAKDGGMPKADWYLGQILLSNWHPISTSWIRPPVEKDYSPLYLPNPLPPLAFSLSPPFLLLSQTVHITPSTFSPADISFLFLSLGPVCSRDKSFNKEQIMTKRECLCLCNCVRMCLFLGPGLLFACFVLFINISCVIEFWNACESTICSCTFLLFVWFYICAWPSTMLSSCMILTFFFSQSNSASQDLLRSIKA